MAEKYDSVQDSDMVEFSTVSSRIVGPGIAAKMRLVLFLIYSCFVCVNFSLYWSKRKLFWQKNCMKDIADNNLIC